MSTRSRGGPLWTPTPTRVRKTQLRRFAERVRHETGLPIDQPGALQRWSTDQPEAFWKTLWSFADVVSERQGNRVLVGGGRMPGAHWFPDARLNFAENLLRRRDDATALVCSREDGTRSQLSFADLHAQVSRLTRALRAAGVRTGDRVAGLLPNIPEAVVAMLASTSLGAIWSSCSPDFGPSGVIDRFGQIEPRVLFCCQSTRYAGRRFDTLERLPAILSGLPSVQRLVVIPDADAAERPALGSLPSAIGWDVFIAEHEAGEIEFTRLPFEHPVYILFSSGTTGKPKCIVHGAGGTLLQHLKEHRLHVDLCPGERLFYYTTCGWMMWNWLVSGLASEASVILYDGSPFQPDAAALFQLAERERISVFGVSAKFLDAVAKSGLEPKWHCDLSSVRTLLSTGSPLSPESFDFVDQKISAKLQLASISGGTDIISCFVLGDPTVPVWRGEIQAPGLGMRVDVFDAAGRPAGLEAGELVCTAPFPSMPVGFWRDPEARRYRAAYFERFPGVWCHGDWLRRTERGGFVIEGRSDAVLNPGGVRIGTAEIYRPVEQIEEVTEALAIGQAWRDDVRIVLFVTLRDGIELDDGLRQRICRAVRDGASPRHVPARVLQVPEIPRTRSGKITELAVRAAVHGRPVDNIEALENPEALSHFRDRPELRN